MKHVDPEALRGALARFPTGVTVVSAIGPAGPAGATANAVASLSLEPPMMLACLDLGSRTLIAVEHARTFGINVLASDQAELARRFSTKDPHPAKWDGIEWTERSGAPTIQGSAIWLACELGDVHDGGDHAIVTGTVVELEAGHGAPLIFHDGEYRPLAPLPDFEPVLRAAYRAFNARDVEAAIELMHPEVDWPNAWEGGRVIGRKQVREYWTRQFASISSSVEPDDFTEEADGAITVDVHQVVRDADGGELISDSRVRHRYRLEDGLIVRMDVLD